MLRHSTVLLVWSSLPLSAAVLCDLSAYKAAPGLGAVQAGEHLRVTWAGASGQELRAVFGVEDGTPRIHELAVRKAGGSWVALGRELVPEFRVTAGVRRISRQQLSPLEALKRTNPEYLDQEKWKAFWDAPLSVPGSANTNPGLPRSESEIRRAAAAFHTATCAVKTNGQRLEISFDGLSLGIFAGQLRFTVYRGVNLVRQEAIASTNEPSVAYKYEAGLKGFAIEPGRRIVWRDVARAWQHYEFGGSPNRDPVGLRARNRLAVMEGVGGSVAVFPARLSPR